MAYDAARGRMLLHGGNDATSNCDGGSQTYCTGTWTYDGRDWTLLTSYAPSPSRVNGQLTWSPVTGDMLLYGGNSTLGPSYFGDYWWFDGSWSKYGVATVLASSPPYGVCFDVARRVLHTLGGESAMMTRREFEAPSTLTAFAGTEPYGLLFHDPARRVTWSLAGSQTAMQALAPRSRHARTAVHTFALDVAAGASLTALTVTHAGRGAGAAGPGLFLWAWNWDTRSWDVIGSHAATSTQTLTAAPPGPASQYVSGTRMWIMASAPPSDSGGAVQSRVATDFVEVQATYTLP